MVTLKDNVACVSRNLAMVTTTQVWALLFANHLETRQVAACREREFKRSRKLDGGWDISMNTMTPSSPRLQVRGKPHSVVVRARHVVEKPRQHQVFLFASSKASSSYSGHQKHEQGELNKSLLAAGCSVLWMLFA